MKIDKFIDRTVEMIFKVGFLMIPVILVYMVIGLVLSFPLMWLWNFTLPDLTNGFLTPIRYWQAWALIVICSILFGGGSRD